jgi:lysophospholipase L1-like esterase
VEVVTFYDENGNAILDAEEYVRFPQVEVEIAGRVGETVGGGAGLVDGVPAGEQQVIVHPASLPPYYEASTRLMITVPSSEVVALPVTLPIGDNVPNRYLAFGDSITEGGRGNPTYRRTLRQQLEEFFGRAEIVNSGLGGTTSNKGSDRFPSEAARHRPAIALIVYGTNDWNACTTPDECFTIRALRDIVRAAQNNAVMPFVATILPTNTGFDERTPPERNVWIQEMNAGIRAMVEEEGAVLMDIHSAFVAAADGGDYSQLIGDHVHPTPLGYDIMAHTMAEAIRESTDSVAARSTPGSAISPRYTRTRSVAGAEASSEDGTPAPVHTRLHRRRN